MIPPLCMMVVLRPHGPQVQMKMKMKMKMKTKTKTRARARARVRFVAMAARTMRGRTKAGDPKLLARPSRLLPRPRSMLPALDAAKMPTSRAAAEVLVRVRVRVRVCHVHASIARAALVTSGDARPHCSQWQRLHITCGSQRRYPCPPFRRLCESGAPPSGGDDHGSEGKTTNRHRSARPSRVRCNCYY